MARTKPTEPPREPDGTPIAYVASDPGGPDFWFSADAVTVAPTPPVPEPTGPAFWFEVGTPDPPPVPRPTGEDR